MATSPQQSLLWPASKEGLISHLGLRSDFLMLALEFPFTNCPLQVRTQFFGGVIHRYNTSCSKVLYVLLIQLISSRHPADPVGSTTAAGLSLIYYGEEPQKQCH